MSGDEATLKWDDLGSDGAHWLGLYLERASDFAHAFRIDENAFRHAVERCVDNDANIARWWAAYGNYVLSNDPAEGALSDTLTSDAMWAVMSLAGPNGQDSQLTGSELSAERAQELRRAVRRSGRLAPPTHRDDSQVTSGGGARLGLGGQKIAYFCMEYGIESELTIYSGGLGVLAGDIAKANQDQERDFIAIGLMWDQDISNRALTPKTARLPRTDPRPDIDLPDTGIEVSVEIRGKDVPLRALRVLGMGSVELLLLEPIHESDQWMTRRLYSGGHDDRLAQELILGVGGMRALRALGLPIDVYHFNEGHALFAGLELVREGMSAGLSFEDAMKSAQTQTVFTTPPAPAGNETHALQHLWDMGGHLNSLSWEQLKTIGGDPFEMTPAALRLSRAAMLSLNCTDIPHDMWAHIEDAPYIEPSPMVCTCPPGKVVPSLGWLSSGKR